MTTETLNAIGKRTMTLPSSFETRALAALREALGEAAEFRGQQLEAIRSIVQYRSRSLVVQRTGWGKSAVYFVATKLLREAGAGPTLIISPLLALMRDQIEAAERMGLNAVTINSSNVDEWPAVEESLLSQTIDVLLISPERLNNQDFRDRLLVPLTESAGLLVVDEAHCISDWGHDFRPDYRRLTRVLELLPANVPVLCTTATANDRVIEDIIGQLGDQLSVIRGTLDRKSLALHVLEIDSQPERMAWLAQVLPTLSGSGIVYCLTVSDTQRVADWLTSRGVPTIAYSGDTGSEDRPKIEQKLKSNEVKAVAATSALGMGFDKPDLAFVVHCQSPDSPVGYYQQVGRAGRAIDEADVVLLVGREDDDIWQYFLETSLPIQANAELVVSLLEAVADWVPMSALEGLVNMKTARLTGLLKILEVEGAIERTGTSYRRTLRPWEFDVDRVERVRDARLVEQQSMRDYSTLTTCRMAYLRRELDDADVRDCGRCDRCAHPIFDIELDGDTVVEAVEFIRRRPVRIEPRKLWIGGTRNGRISDAERLQEGRALSLLSDPGWGRELLENKHGGAKVSDSMVAASAELIKEWLSELPDHIMYVPPFDNSRDLVPDFADRLANALGIPITHCLVKTKQTQPQKLMENSAQQVRNVHDAFSVVGSVPTGSVLLVDDVSDSRWTLTCIGALLGAAGAGPMYPFTIAKTRG